MVFLILSGLFALACVYCYYKSSHNDYYIPHLVLDPRDASWCKLTTTLIYATIILLMFAIYLTTHLPTTLTIPIKVAVSVFDAFLAVGVLDIWSYSVKHSREYGLKYVSRPKSKGMSKRQIRRHMKYKR